MMYIVTALHRLDGKTSYVTIEPIREPGNDREWEFPLGFAWTHARAEAVRFPTSWHAEAVVSALPNGGRAIEVNDDDV